MIERCFIAKTGYTDSIWLPLWMHHRDTAETIKYLFEEFVSESIAVSSNIDMDTLKKTAVFLAYTHDIGKSTIGFQYKISHGLHDIRSELEHYGLKIPEYMDKSKIQCTPHGLAGEEILKYFGCNDSIAAVVGSHHGVPSESGHVFGQDLTQHKNDIVGYENYYGYDSNKIVLGKSWKKIIDIALADSGFLKIDDLPVINSQGQMILSGLLIMADWIASNTDYFPLIDIEQNGPDNDSYENRINDALDSIDFPMKWESYMDSYSINTFRNSFGFYPSEVQKSVIKIVENTDKPGIFILEAPMGCGKTEAALASAELLANKTKKSGLFFGLPTQATANGIFPRIQKWAERQSKYEYHSIQLSHGSAQLNDVFTGIQKGIPDHESDSGLIVHSWFCNNKSCLADFVVATVDHMLMMALKRHHVMLLHLGLSEKVVIIDEVHAYDAYMNQYLEMALQWLGKYKTPVILLSATLPSERRKALINAYNQSKEEIRFEDEMAYPVLTWTDGNRIFSEVLPDNSVGKEILIKKINTESVYEIIKRVVQYGGCAGIIMNTVKRAQKIADELRQLPNGNVLLYHAQFISADRMRKERELLNRVGKESTNAERKGFIVVGTQVLEQSLDIDFDVLITDICPIDLLIQRIGRLHRHSRDYRPDQFKMPECYVVTDEYEDSKSASSYIYSNWLINASMQMLPNKIVVPKDIPYLVNSVYSLADDSSEYKKYINDLDKRRVKAKTYLLKAPKCRSIHNLLEIFVSDNQAEATVRDGISSVEVIVMQRRQDGKIYFMNNSVLSDWLTDEEFKKIAEQTLKLPAYFCQMWNVDDTIKELEEKCIKYIEPWQRSSWTAGKLVLFFDENMESELQNNKLYYSFENGLQYRKVSDEDE